MKYPQLVSMPSAVQDWLDEQLEARGIDAVVYTRYILSLLQRDTLDLPDDLLTLSPSKGKEVGRRGRKRGRNREEYWDVWDCEQLKRSAAVECLMSASDQKCGIEKLVDELCAKLKEIQSEGENSVHLELSQTSVSSKESNTSSPQDQVQKYYAAFPPLNSKFAETNTLITLIPEPSSAWSGKKVLANSFGKNKSCNELLQETGSNVEKLLVGLSWADEDKENRGKNNNLWKEVGRENMKSRNQMKEKAKGKKDGGYGFASDGLCSGSQSELLRVFHHNRQNEESKADDSLGWDAAACRRLYERQTGDVGHIEEEGLQDKLGDETGQDMNVQGTDDKNLAQLIAKFDHSIEALWNPDENPSSPDNFSSSDGNTDCDQELPLDFHQLLSSPSERYLSVELYNLSNKRNTNLFSNNNSFIQCGTNITSSIWSDQPSQENSIDQDDFVMDYTHCEPQNLEEGSTYSKQLHHIVDGEDKIVGNKQVIGNKLEAKECPKSVSIDSNITETKKLNAPTEEKLKVAWTRYDDFPSFFSSLPWTVNCALGEITQTSNKKWSDVETSGNHGNYSPFGNIFSISYSNQNKSPTPNLNTSNKSSLNTLNHNKEDSSFTEVIPKQNSFIDTLAENVVQEKEVNAPLEDETKEGGGDLVEVEKEEEDLLTSTKTHFRPIRMENIDSKHNANNNNVASYADGTTFVIPTNLEEVAFRRSESGALYLETENDAELETPNKYMEYKEKEAYGGRLRYEDFEQSCSGDFIHEFVPKFKVRQNEKCCQTEESEDMLQSDEEVDTKRCRQEVKALSDADDFYFPDDHFAENIIKSLENNNDSKTEVDCRNNYALCQQKENFSSISSSLSYTSLSRNGCKNYKGLFSEPLEKVAPKKENWCKCNLHTWKTGWPRASQVSKSTMWESAGNDKPHTWYNIWRSSPGPSHCSCKNDVDVPDLQSSSVKEPEAADGTNTKSLQYCRLREEVTMEGEQLLSDLSYVQHLFQGSNWQDEANPEENSVPEWGPEHEENENKGKYCLSPAEDSAQEMLLYAEDNGCTQSLPAPLADFHLPVKGRKSVDDIGISCKAHAFPKSALFSVELETEWKQNDRPFNVKAIQKDRKRRHSASQRACSYYLEGSCRRPHCRFSHDLATVPCRFWADSSCLKGIACPFLHGSAQALRPVTL